MKFLNILFILIISAQILTAENLERRTDVPEYLWVDFHTKAYKSKDVTNFITKSGSKQYWRPSEEDMFTKSPLIKPRLNKEGIKLIQISNNSGGQTETWVAVNPTDPLNAIATCNDAQSYSQGMHRMPSYYTTDGGETWNFSMTDNHRQSFIVPGANTIFDPVIAFNQLGEAFYAYGYVQYSSGDNGPGGIYASLSRDGGASWTRFNDEDDLYIIAESSGGNAGFHDRYSIASDFWSEQYKGNMYITWRFFKDGRGIEVATSELEDEYYFWNDKSLTSYVATQAPVPAVGPNGEVWVTWRQTSSGNSDVTQAPIVVSRDGGKTWDDHSIAMENWNIGALRDNLPSYARVSLVTKDSMRISTNPIIAADNSDGPRSGWVYVVQPGKEGGRQGATRMYLAILKDPNTTNWQKIRIDNNEFGNDMFLPSICVDHETGYVFVLYYSSQNDQTNKLTDAYLAYSYDGQTFKHKRLTDESFIIQAQRQSDLGNYYWGDYTSVSALNNHVYPVFWKPSFADGRFGSNDLYTATIFTGPDSPVIAVENGDEVKLTWTDIVDGLGEPITDYSVKLFKNGNLIQEFGMDLNTYTDSDVTPGDEVTYGVQVISNDVRGEGRVGSVDVVIGGELTPQVPTNVSTKPNENGIIVTWKNPSRTTDDAEFNTIDAINFYNGNNKIATIEEGITTAGEFQTQLFEITTDNFYDNLYISAVRRRGDDEAESEKVQLPLSYSGAPIENINLDFESQELVPNYNQGDWAITNEAGFESDYSLTDTPGEDYDNDIDAAIVLAPVIVPENTNAFVFDHIALVHSADQVFVQLSTNMGETWPTMLVTNEAYNDDSFGDDLETSEWLQAGFDLDEEGISPGDTVLIRLTMKSNSPRSAEGVYFDNMKFENKDNLRTGNVVSVEEQYANSFAFSVNPNPASDDITISIKNNMNNEIKLELYDNLGNKVFDVFNKRLNAGDHIHQMNVSNLPSGVYYLRMSNGKGIKTVSLNVQK